MYVYSSLLFQIQMSPLAMSHHVQSTDGPGATSAALPAAAPAKPASAPAAAESQPEVLYTNKRGLTQEACRKPLGFHASVGY